MTVTTGRTTRVIGWYHSHPHITVLPSHVGMYFRVARPPLFRYCLLLITECIIVLVVCAWIGELNPNVLHL